MILRYETMGDATYKHYFDCLNELRKAGVLLDDAYWSSINLLNSYWKEANGK